VENIPQASIPQASGTDDRVIYLSAWQQNLAVYVFHQIFAAACIKEKY
jgi:hypothetical protein